MRCILLCSTPAYKHTHSPGVKYKDHLLQQPGICREEVQCCIWLLTVLNTELLKEQGVHDMEESIYEEELWEVTQVTALLAEIRKWKM